MLIAPNEAWWSTGLACITFMRRRGGLLFLDAHDKLVTAELFNPKVYHLEYQKAHPLGLTVNNVGRCAVVKRRGEVLFAARGEELQGGPPFDGAAAAADAELRHGEPAGHHEPGLVGRESLHLEVVYAGPDEHRREIWGLLQAQTDERE